MKKNYYIILLTCLFIFSFTSCNDALDLNPKDQVSDPYFWKIPKDFELAANDFYLDLQKVPQYIDKNSDIAFGGGPNDVSNGTYLIPANSDIWDSSYKNIRGINYLLKKANESNLGSTIDRWVGEAYFFRAYYYWKLVEEFGGVPKIETVLNINSPELYTPKSSQEEIVDFIISDLEKALAKLPKQSEITSDEMGRVTQGAALALKARVALYQGTWEKYRNETKANDYLQKAIDASKALVESGEYSLFKGKGVQSYKFLFIFEGDDCSEVILARRYYIFREHHNWTRELWFNAMMPTKNLADMYLVKDGLPTNQSPNFKGYNTLTSEFENRDPRMEMTFVIPGTQIFFEGGTWQTRNPSFKGTNATRTGYMLRKFLDETSDAVQFRGSYDFKEFRYGEVLLILAEALYEKNGSISDTDLDLTINQLRERVNMPKLTNIFVTANNLNMQNEIRRERTVELAFEGYRRSDLRRWKIAETVLPKNIRGVKFVGTDYQNQYPELNIGVDITVDADGYIIVDKASERKFVNPKHYLNPLPSQQVQLSKGTLTPNEGWN